VCAGPTIITLTDIARNLNQHVLQKAASVSPRLLLGATLCCQRISYLLLDWQVELREHGTVSWAAATIRRSLHGMLPASGVFHLHMAVSGGI
jgi:hypothetical protein